MSMSVFVHERERERRVIILNTLKIVYYVGFFGLILYDTKLREEGKDGQDNNNNKTTVCSNQHIFTLLVLFSP